MTILVVGKPVLNVILACDTFPLEGTKNKATEKYELIGGASVYVAALLSSWGVNVNYTGVVAGDEAGTKIKRDLDSFKVNTKYLEINYETKSAMNYIILNKNGSSTGVMKDNGVELTKYKYDFKPDVIITDGTDMAGTMASFNNFPSAIKIVLANKVSEQLYDISKKCNYVVANTDFARALTKLEFEFNKPKALVNFFQKIKDLNKAEYILMLREHGTLYACNRQVKMIPAINTTIVDDTNAGYTFFAAFCYGVVSGYDMDVCAKIANNAAGLSLAKIGITSIPSKEEVFKLAGFEEEKVETIEEEIVNEETVNKEE